MIRMQILNVLVEQRDYCIFPELAEESHDSVIVHIGSIDITKLDYNNVNVEDLAKKIINNGIK